MPPRCYAYCRISTPEQEKGDGYRRQMEAAEAYAKREGLELDTADWFDKGVSAYRGRNLSEGGKLGEFLAQVEARAIEPGSRLLVENVDRLTRQGAWRAVVKIIGRLTEAGVWVVTLTPERVYSNETMKPGGDGFMRMMELAFAAERASGESARKVGMLRQAWTAKRRRAHAEPLTARCPSWLELVDKKAGTWRVIEERADVVRRIYTEAAARRGTHAITEGLNRDAVPPFGSGKQWHRSAVVKLLAAENVIGTYEAHTTDPDGDRGQAKRRELAERIENYYPAIVDRELWQRVRDLRTDPTTAKLRRGGQASAPAWNLLGGLARCALCGAAFVMVNKGNTPKTRGPMARYLVCGKARTGAGCSYAAVPLSTLEPALLADLPFNLAGAPAGAGAEELDAALANVEAAWLAHMDEVAELRTELRRRGASETIAELLRQLDAEAIALRAERAALEARRDAASGPLVASRLTELADAVAAPELDRAAVNAAMRMVFASAVIDPDWKAVTLEYRHGGQARIVYGFPTEPPPARNVPRADGSPPPPGY